jgi:hypothetical protein
MTRARQEKATIRTTLHDDGATSHRVEFANGDSQLFLFPPGHALEQQFKAAGEKAKLQAAINSVDTTEKAIEKCAKLQEAFDNGKWSLQGEGSPGTGLARAIAEIKGIDLSEAEEIVSGLSKKQQADLRATERVAALLAKYKKQAGESDGDALLDGILGSDEGGRDAQEAA